MSQEYLTKEDYDMLQKRQQKASWYNPAKTPMTGDNGVLVLPQTHYLGEAGGQLGAVPTWEDPVLDARKAKAALAQYKSGNTEDRFKVTADPFIGKWQKVAHEYDELKLNAIKSGSLASIKSAGIGHTADYSAIDIVNVANEVVNTELRPFALEMAVKTVAVPNLQIDVDAWTRFTGDKNIGEGVPPVFKLGSTARTNFDLPKHGSAIGLTFEAQARAVHDVYRLNVENAITDLKRIKSNLIATELETASDVGGADWATDSNNPYDNIGTVSDTIYGNNGTVNAIASHDRVFRDFVSNDNYKGTGERASHEGPFSTARVVDNIRGLEGITWYIDNEKTNTIATVYEKEAVWKMQGPVRTAVWRDEAADVDMFRIFDFMLCEIIIAGRIRDLTGVSA